MAVSTKRGLLTWAPVLLACAFGCATETQGDGLLPGPLGEAGSGGAAAGSGSTDGGTSAGTNAAAGTNAGGGGAGAGTGGTATTGGTFMNGGTFSQGGTFAVAGTSAGGMGGGGAGGAAAGAGGKGGSGGAGGSAAGAGGKGGSGGTGGNPGTGCAAHPIGAKTAWTATANVQGDPCVGAETVYCGPAANAVDGTTTTRFTTVAARTGTEWVQIDFGASVTVSQLVLHTAAGSSDYTHGYEVRMSASAADIATSPVIVSGTGVVGDTTITFPAQKTGQFLRINQTTAIAGWWSVQEIDASCQ